MYTREILNTELKDISIAKYLKPEAQAEAQAEAQVVEEKLRNLNDIREKKKGKFSDEDEEEKEVYDRLVDIIIQNVVIRETTFNFLLKSLLKEEVCTVIDTTIQLNEIIDELDNIESQFLNYPDDDLTEEENDKLYFLGDYVCYTRIIFADACVKIGKQLDKFIDNLVDIIIYIKDARAGWLSYFDKRKLISGIIEKISKSIDSEE